MEKKIANYESFIEDKLKVDLSEVERLWNKKTEDYKSWQELKNFVLHADNHNGNELVTTYDVGLGVYMSACLENSDKIIVNIGCDCYLEMYYKEAIKYIELRMKYLKKELEFLKGQAVHIKTHIKLVLLAINELS